MNSLSLSLDTKRTLQRIFKNELSLAEFDEIAKRHGYRRNGSWDVEADCPVLVPTTEKGESHG